MAGKDGLIKKLLKNKAVRKILMAFAVKGIIVITIIGAIFIAFAAIKHVIDKLTTIAISSSMRENTDTTSTLFINSAERHYEINTDFTENVEKAIKDLGVSKESLGIDDNMDLLVRFYEAEIFTSFPDLRERDEVGTEIPEGELQGSIKFVRNYPDADEETLEYMAYEKFKTEIGKFGYDLDAGSNSLEKTYTTDTEVIRKYNEIRRYFTLDSEYNVIIAVINTEDVTTNYSDYAKQEGEVDEHTFNYTVNIQKINYQLVVDKYSMPIEFLISMLTISKSSGFCEAIVDLVENSRIVIELQDSNTNTVIVEKYDYQADFNLERKINYNEITRL